MNLNQQQQQAIEYTKGPLLVLAGAGSGKTRVITEKIAYLITHKNYSASHIAAITFTNKAAREMQERINKIIPHQQSRGLTVCTFHSLGMRILREECSIIGLKKNFSIFDASDSAKIIQELFTSSGKELLFKAKHQISLWKNAFISPLQALKNARNKWEEQIASLYASYQNTLQSYQAVDFDDLIRLPCEIFAKHAEIKYKWQLKLRHLLIDECQDTNACQYELMKYLVSQEGKFTAVGDDDQSIYAWRGADLKNLSRLQKDFPQLKVIKLEQNYRSTARILRVANAVIAHNPKLFEKKLWSEYGLGEKIHILSCADEKHEAETVVNKIHMHRLLNEKRFAHYAILYRGNHQSRLFEEALRSAKIPYQLSGGQSFFDKSEIKDILAYIRLIANHDDDPAFLRAITTPKKGIGDTSLAKLNEYAHDQHCSLFQAAQQESVLNKLSANIQQKIINFTDLIRSFHNKAYTLTASICLQELLDNIQYQDYLEQTEEAKSAEFKWRNVQDLVSWLGQKGESDHKNIIELSQTIALMTLLDNKNKEDIDAVRLSTLHASKGLEYPHVFLVGCEEGLFPHADSIEEGNIEEERRLMYVGITRAQQTLTITHCVKRRRMGTWLFTEATRFIEEMPKEDIELFGRNTNQPIVSKEEGKAKLAFLKERLNHLNKK